MTEPAMEIRGVVKRYGSVTALSGVDFVVPDGSTVAVLGPSGCGKTTLLRLIAGFERPDAGTVVLHGQAVAGEGTWVPPQHRDFGYVAQEGSLFPHLSVGRNVAFGLPRARRRDRARVVRLLEAMSLTAEHADRYPNELSGGQQQRVAIARALARAPRIVLLDEPFAALDVDLRVSARTAVASALAAEKVTTLLVTHDRTEALSFAGTVAVMQAGRFTHVGTPQEVFEQPACLHTARSVGDVALLAGTVAAGSASCALGRIPLRGKAIDGPATLMLRPDQLQVVANGQPNATVVSLDYFGHETALQLRLDGTGELISARIPGAARAGIGEPVRLEVAGPAIAYPA